MRDVRMSLHPSSGSIEIGGVNIADAVHGLMLTASAHDRIPVLKLDLHVIPAEIDGRMVIEIPERTRDALIELGWTPPAE